MFCQPWSKYNAGIKDLELLDDSIGRKGASVAIGRKTFSTMN